jgi:hypothetical protein
MPLRIRPLAADHGALLERKRAGNNLNRRKVNHWKEKLLAWRTEKFDSRQSFLLGMIARMCLAIYFFARSGRGNMAAAKLAHMLAAELIGKRLRAAIKRHSATRPNYEGSVRPET